MRTRTPCTCCSNRIRNVCNAVFGSSGFCGPSLIQSRRIADLCSIATRFNPHHGMAINRETPNILHRWFALVSSKEETIHETSVQYGSGVVAWLSDGGQGADARP